MMHKKKLVLFCAAILSVFISGTILSNPVSAAMKSGSSINTVYQKATVLGIKKCYGSDYMVTNYNANGNRANYVLNYLFTGTGKNNTKILFPNLSSSQVKDIMNGNTTSCYSLFNNAIPTYFGVSPESVKFETLPTIGYKKVSNNGYYNGCISFRYYVAGDNPGESKPFSTLPLCFLTQAGALQTANGSIVKSPMMTSSVPSNLFEFPNGFLQASGVPTVTVSNGHYTLSFMNRIYPIPKPTNGTSWTDIINGAKVLFNMTGLKSANGVDQGVVSTIEPDEARTTYTKEKTSVSAPKAIKYFTNNSFTNVKKFTKADIVTLYMNYINQMLAENGNGVTYLSDTCKAGQTVTEARKIKKELLAKDGVNYVYRKSNKTWCVLDIPATQEERLFTGINDDKTKLKKRYFKTIVKEMQKDAYDNYKVPKLSAEDVSAAEEESNDSDVGETPSCYGAMPALGWIFCPVINATGTAVNGIYGFIKTSFLVVDANILSSGGNNDYLHQAWGKFRDYANIVFVILLALVILSQLTGFGISNYGIKKTLPRLIIMVVLVNISFVLCQIAVDLSNILGDSLESTFTNFANQVKVGSNGGNTDLGSVVGDIVAALAGGGVLAIGGIAIAAATWESWLVPLLIFLIGCLIGVFFFAIILGVRQAAVIILVALSPAAIVCYSLPNTKKIFDKWFKLFSSMLFVFPIAGILMGGGIWASRLLFAAGADVKDGTGVGGFFFAMVALLMQVVPFFFLPTLVKSSLAAAGRLGDKISGFGDNLGRLAKGGAKNSHWAKDMQERAKDTQELRAGRRGERMLRRNQRASDFINNHSRLGRVLHPVRTGKGGLAEMSNNRRNHRINRANQAVLAASLNSRDRSDAFEQRQINDFADEFTSSFDKQGMLDNEVLMGKEAAAALQELEQDPNNLQAKGRYLAAAKQLAKSGPERGRMQNVLDTHAYNNHGTVDPEGNAKISDGLRWASSAWKKEIAQKKDNALGVFNRAHEMSQGSINLNGMEAEMVKGEDGEMEPTGMWINHTHDNQVAQDIGASQIGKMDKPELKNYIAALKSGALKPEAAKSLIAAAHEANDNPNISVDGDKQELVDQIASMDYTNPVSGDNNSVSSVDSSTMNIMARSSQAELTRIANYAANGKINNKGDSTELTQLANVAEATLRGANTGKVNLSAEKAEQLNRILAADKRKTIPYSLRVDHSNPAPPPPSGYHDTGTGSGIIIPD